MNVVRIVLVDGDQSFCTEFSAAAGRYAGAELVASGRTSTDAMRLCERHSPDLLVLCVDGLDTAPQELVSALIGARATRVLAISADPHCRDLKQMLAYLEMGCLDIRIKPSDAVGHDALVRLARSLGNVPTRTGRSTDTIRTEMSAPRLPRTAPIQCVGIVASTGGPPALESLLCGLGRDFPIPIVLVQHIFEGFDNDFSEWLAQATRFQVRVAAEADMIRPGLVLMAPVDRHLHVGRQGRVRLDGETPPFHGHRPSGNELLGSLAQSYGHRLAGVVLTGMGEDGALGLGKIGKAGGHVFAQDAASAAIDGMPKAARRECPGAFSGAPGEIARHLRALAGMSDLGQAGAA